MLPPFVPPSARQPSQDLPLITEFVLDPADRPGSAAATQPMDEVGAEVGDRGWGGEVDAEVLPSILEFAWGSAVGEPAASEHIARHSGSGEPEAEQSSEAGGGAAEEPGEPGEVRPEPAPESLTSPAGDAPGRPSAPAAAHPIPEPSPETSSEAAGEPAPEAVTGSADRGEPGEAADVSVAAGSAGGPSDEWMTRERSSFDWQSIASLGAPEDEARRAEAEWSSTDWESGGESAQEHILAVMSHVARRVRSGELEVRGNRQMTPEAALAAVLAAMLAEPGQRG